MQGLIFPFEGDGPHLKKHNWKVNDPPRPRRWHNFPTVEILARQEVLATMLALFC